MDDVNPYQAPAIAADENGVPGMTGAFRVPGVSPGQTIGPRFVAANVDFLLAAVFVVLALKTNPVDIRALHVGVAVLAFLAYYFIFELFFSRTPGKFLMGLVVRKFDGSRCGWREAAIRTGFRVLEANPIFLGALPACAMILISKNRQRLGDKVADTVVVLARRVS